MNMGPPSLERHVMLKSDRLGTYRKVESSIRDYVEQLRHKSDPMDVGEMTCSEYHWEEG